ncbi:iron-containing alcohol dehydrogenase [bacterium]|nr:iron-containing alcohol dehydrogenase [bacterium]
MPYDDELSFNFLTPTKVIFRPGATEEARIEIRSLGGERTLIVTDEGIVRAGLAERIKESLGDLCVGMFSEIPQDSGVHVVNDAAKLARSLKVDSLVSLGGGSVIDTAKALAVILKEGGNLADYQGMQMLDRPQTLHICIPTTAGTGSEVTFAAVVKDHDRGQKDLLFDYHLAPNVAILDPHMVSGLPPRITAFTGMDALTHAVEAVHALQRNPIADGLALQAIRLIATYLHHSVQNGDDLLARGQMQIAATMAGMAFTNAMVGLVHAMAHSLGARFGVPHGVANAILLPHGMRFNMAACADQYALVAEAMGVSKPETSDDKSAEEAVKAIEELNKKIGLPGRLREVDVPREGLKDCAELSLSDGAIVYNPRPVFEAEEVLDVYEEAW